MQYFMQSLLYKQVNPTKILQKLIHIKAIREKDETERNLNPSLKLPIFVFIRIFIKLFSRVEGWLLFFWMHGP